MIDQCASQQLFLIGVETITRNGKADRAYEPAVGPMERSAQPNGSLDALPGGKRISPLPGQRQVGIRTFIDRISAYLRRLRLGQDILDFFLWQKREDTAGGGTPGKRQRGVFFDVVTQQLRAVNHLGDGVALLLLQV